MGFAPTGPRFHPIAGPWGAFGQLQSSSLTTNLTGSNNDLTFTADKRGAAGNAISVTYVDPGGTTATLGVTVSGNDITVNLGRAASAINSTAAQVKAAIEAVAAAAALVDIANAVGNDGTGLVTAMSKATLSGGTDWTIGYGAPFGASRVKAPL